MACAGGLEHEIRAALSRGIEAGQAISVGPHVADRDAMFQPLLEPFRVPEGRAVPSQLGLSEDALRDAVRSARLSLGLDNVVCSPESVSVSIHRDDTGRARLAFVINPSARAVRAELSLFGIARAVDALDGSEFHARLSCLEVPVPAQTVRMLELFS